MGETWNNQQGHRDRSQAGDASSRSLRDTWLFLKERLAEVRHLQRFLIQTLDSYLIHSAILWVVTLCSAAVGYQLLGDLAASTFRVKVHKRRGISWPTERFRIRWLLHVRRIFMNLDTTFSHQRPLYLYTFWFATTNNTNMAAMRTSEVGTILIVVT
jgi:hypothetical protein